MSTVCTIGHDLVQVGAVLWSHSFGVMVGIVFFAPCKYSGYGYI